MKRASAPTRSRSRSPRSRSCPPPPSAKEIVKAEVCGAGGLRDRRAAPGVMDLVDVGPPTDPPKQAAPFFTATTCRRASTTASTRRLDDRVRSRATG